MLVDITRLSQTRHTTWVLWWNQTQHSTTTRLQHSVHYEQLLSW